MKILILHGWGHNGELWQNLADKLGKNAIAIDLPGFGDEPLVNDNWGVPEYAGWVEKYIKKNKYNNLIMIGHSFGGRIAAEIASKNPKYLKGLILSGAPCLYRPSLKVKLRIKIYKFFKFLIPQNFRRLFYANDLKNASLKNLEKIFRNVVNYDQTEQLKKIKLNTLLIWGENDKDVPLKIAKEMNELIKNSELIIIENSGHNSYLEKPNLFFGYVKNYINNISN